MDKIKTTDYKRRTFQDSLTVTGSSFNKEKKAEMAK